MWYAWITQFPMRKTELSLWVDWACRSEMTGRFWSFLDYADYSSRY